MPTDRQEPEDEAFRLDQAAAWKVRLDSPAASETDFIAFEAWLGSRGARAAFDHVEQVSNDIDAHRENIGRAMAEDDAKTLALAQANGQKSESRRRLIMGGVGLGIGAIAAAAICGVILAPGMGWTTFITAKGASRSLKLADGTIVNLNSASAIKVKMSDRARHVILDDGEAAFDVAHEPARPFFVAAGERQVRVVGTEFNVLKDADRVSVTVRRGIVEVSSLNRGAFDVARLTAGEQVMFSDDKIIRRANAAERAFAWQSGRLIYEDAALAELVSDLNRYYSGPIRVEGQDTAALRFSGVLTLDGREQVVRRLEGFLPIEAIEIGNEIVLRAHAKPVTP